MNFTRWLGRIGLAAILVLVLIQLVPYGRAHANPPVQQEPAWDSTETRAVAVRACFDCHSNQSRWPWYSHVAPVSWLVQRDVIEGRAALNFSEWNTTKRGEDIVDTVQDGSMPPWFYMLMHADARLSASDKQKLVNLFGTLAPARDRAENNENEMR